LVVHRGQGDEGQRANRPRIDATFGADLEGAEAPRLQVRRSDDCLRMDAGRRARQRPLDALLSSRAGQSVVNEDLTARISVDVAAKSEEPLLANLLELYIHDLSDIFEGLEIDPDGRFGYRRLPLFWSQPDRRFPFLIRLDGRVAGFALIQRGSPL